MSCAAHIELLLVVLNLLFNWPVSILCAYMEKITSKMNFVVITL